jgi:hypothetical protein
MKNVLAALLALCATVTYLKGAPDSTDVVPTGVYRLRLTAAGGIQRSFFAEPRTQFESGRTSNGASIVVRALWQPEHLLSVGLVSGFTTIASDRLDTPMGEDRVELTLSAIPMQLAFAMRFAGFEVGTGIGGYLLISTASVQNEVATASSQFEIGVSAWLGYTAQLTDQLGIGAELCLHNLSYRRITGIAPQVRLRYDLFTY